MALDLTQDLVLAGIAVTTGVGGALAWFSHWLHNRSRRDANSGIKSVHDRLDRHYHDDGYGIERLRTAIAELRKDFVQWWKRDK